MHITLHPIRQDRRPEIVRKGDALVIDGEVFDFAPLPEGAELPRAAIDSPCFVGPVRREAGRICLGLLLAHGAGAPGATLFPAALELTGDGPLPLPPFAAGPEETESAETEPGETQNED